MLLTLITNYKKNMFKVNEIDPNIFWVKQKDISEEKKIHSFLWLNLIDRKNDSKLLQRIISAWMVKNTNYKKKIWENSLLSKRTISWILNVDIILDNCTFDFKKKFLDSIIVQTNHLKKNLKFEKNYLKKLQVLTSLILSGLVFKEYKDNFDIGIRELEKLIKTSFDNDGFPNSRNPNDLIFFLKFLIICKECIKDAQQYIPDFLEDIINKNLDCISSITPNDQVPLFNGGTEENLEELKKIILDLNYKIKSKKNLVGGINTIKNKDNIIFFDIGSPPSKSFSTSYQCGPLSFEYYLDGFKIITNCGFGTNISFKAELLSRLTSAQSSLTINDTSVAKFERNKLINKIFGHSIKRSFKTFDINFDESADFVTVSGSHNGYQNNFHCIHRRKLSLNKKTSQVIGKDQIIKKKEGKSINFDLRFHLYPGLNAVKTISGNSILIQISKNKSLIFTTKNEKVTLEKSIFLGRSKIFSNTCINISGNLENKDKIIHWEIKKNLIHNEKN